MKKNTDKAKDIGVHMAQHYYHDFTTHVEYLGPAWKWENFPEFVQKHAECGSFLCFPRKTKNIIKLEKICGKAAKKEAERLMEDGKWKLAMPIKIKTNAK